MANDSTSSSASHSAEKLESFLLNAGIAHEHIGDGTWLLRDPNWVGAQIVVQNTEPLVIFRVKLMDLPADLSDAKAAKLFRHLLQLNASDMLQGAYALEGNALQVGCQSDAKKKNEAEVPLHLAVHEGHCAGEVATGGGGGVWR